MIMQDGELLVLTIGWRWVERDACRRIHVFSSRWGWILQVINLLLLHLRIIILILMGGFTMDYLSGSF